MRKNEITQAQGKAVSKTIHGITMTAALVLDIDSLYTERRTWGKPVRFLKSTKTTVKQDHLGCVETGWLVMAVSAFSYTPDIKQRIVAADAFVKNFTGSVADVLDEHGQVRRDVVPADVVVMLFNNRNLFTRPEEPVAEVAPEPVAEALKKSGKAQTRVMNFLTKREGETLTVGEIVAGLNELGEKTWYNATSTALKALAAQVGSGIVEVAGDKRAYKFER